ncbi:hypothetical protein [Halomarina oriensis]|uniref:Uncharacterized protein n=1 Tax=Halomarina oriensis TaxID=671145 RepID=A0A6B0GSM6_9EURY|nr:hypothetical protein [Halomarina oriensis]MWG36317.1 hypothetical protein [Halomarina oriensis]
MTQNHSYDTPQRGATNWDVPLNGNFEALDTDVEIRDRDTNKGNYEPKRGSKFLATDTKNVYLGDGSQWQFFATMGGIEGRIFVQSSEPNGSEGDVWIDTS